MTDRLAVSVVVSTCDRVRSLEQCLDALGRLEYEPLEVVVVGGPSTDGTAELLASLGSGAKVASCGETNLAMSRNIGVSLASGEVVAFIDDDAYPDPWWLAALVAEFANEEVAAVGGPVFDHTGHRLQARFSTCDRRGNAEQRFESPALAAALTSPYSDRFAYPIGTNALFRRSHLVEIGGFDEQFTYYHEETDATRRLLDRGYAVVALDRGYVFHKFLASSRRTDDRVLRDRYTVMRSHTYFAARHLPDSTAADWRREGEAGAATMRADLLWHVEQGNLTSEDEARFERDVTPAIDEGISMALEGARTRPAEWFTNARTPFVPFERREPATGRRLHLSFLVEEYPPEPVEGIGRAVHSLATGLAALGHVVRVVCPSPTHDRVDLEDGVWVHRVTPSDAAAPGDVPPRIWALADAMRRELEWITRFAPIDVVQVPNWNSLGIAALRDPVAPTVLALYTPLAVVADIDDRVDPDDTEVRDLLALEAECYGRAGFFLASGPDIVASIEERYRTRLPADRLGIVAHGIQDPRRTRGDVPLEAPPGELVDVLVVGRLEPRKGTDLMLEYAARALARQPSLRVVFAGADRHADDPARSYQARFERAHPELVGRVAFRGRVSEADLDALYESCEMVAMPSRSESFGLTVIEAMARGKPVLATDLPSTREIVEPGRTGEVLPLGAVDAWADALVMLARSEPTRASMGRAGRARFVERYDQGVMATAAEAFYRGVAAARRPAPIPAVATPPV